MRIYDAIFKLNPTIVTIRDGVGYDINENVVEYDMEEAKSLVDSNEYRSKRSVEYPPIGDQLDDLFHAGAFSPEMAAKIQAVKDKYPKGS